MMKFYAHYDRPPVRGRLLYVVGDHAFDFRQGDPPIPPGRVGTVTLAIDTLQLDADVETGQLIGVWGYFPREGWKTTKLRSPSARPGSLHVSFGRPVETGSSYALEAEAKWRRLFDNTTGWLHIQQTDNDRGELVEFANGIVAGLSGDRLVELLLHPEFVES